MVREGFMEEVGFELGLEGGWGFDRVMCGRWEDSGSPRKHFPIQASTSTKIQSLLLPRAMFFDT